MKTAVKRPILSSAKSTAVSPTRILFTNSLSISKRERGSIGKKNYVSVGSMIPSKLCDGKNIHDFF